MNRTMHFALSLWTRPKLWRIHTPAFGVRTLGREVCGSKPIFEPCARFAHCRSFHSLPKCFKPTIAEAVVLSRSKVGMQRNLIMVRFQSSQQTHSPQKLKALTVATYVSFFIGACMLTAIVVRFYTKAKYRARGMEIVTDRDFSKRTPYFRFWGYTLPMFMANSVDKIYHFEVRDDDIWIVSFPKAGTTWMQEIVYLVTSDLDFAGALSKPIDERVPYFEFVNPGISTIAKLPSPRLIKTHLPFSLLPKKMEDKKPKIIYIARNPKDTAVSYYHFTKLLTFYSFKGDFELFFSKFMSDNLPYCPWWKHVKEGWEGRHNDNVLFVRYEDMKKDLPAVVRQVAAFLGKPLLESQVAQIVEHASFARMKQNDMTNYSWYRGWGFHEGMSDFLRKGIIGDWKNVLTDKMAQRSDQMEASHLGPVGLTFDDQPSAGDSETMALSTDL